MLFVILPDAFLNTFVNRVAIQQPINVHFTEQQEDLHMH